MARLVTFGHVPLEISKICHYFRFISMEPSRTLNHKDDLCGLESLVLSGCLEIKLNNLNTFKARGLGDLIDKFKLLFTVHNV